MAALQCETATVCSLFALLLFLIHISPFLIRQVWRIQETKLKVKPAFVDHLVKVEAVEERQKEGLKVEIEMPTLSLGEGLARLYCDEEL